MAHSGGARRAPSRPGANGSSNRVLASLRLLIRPEVIGTALVVLAAATVPFLWSLTGILSDAADELVRLLGVHAFTLVLVVGVLGLLIATRRINRLLAHRRQLVGAVGLAGFLAGALGHWHPDREIGEVPLSIHSVGGDLGRSLTVWPDGTAVWVLLGLSGFALVWPRTASALGRGTLATGVVGLTELWRARLDRHAWRAITRVSAQVASVRLGRPSPAAGPPVADPIEEIAGPPMPELVPPVVVTDDQSAPPAAGLAADSSAPDAPDRPAKQMPMDMETPVDQLRHSEDGWPLPPITVLEEAPAGPSRTVDNQRRAELITETLASFGVDARVVQVNEGPTITQFGVEPGWDVKSRLVTEQDASGRPILDDDGQPVRREVETARTRIRVSRITALNNDLALALAAPALRIEAPVPGKPMVGIEVPNRDTVPVTLREVMQTSQYREALTKMALPIALGQGVSGEPVIADLAKMPHVLIAGTTGAGKSVCLNAIISGLLMHLSPEQLRLVMIDPKRVELADFAAIPHLAFSRIVVEMDEVVGTLQAVINEMESRYRKFAAAGVRNVAAYNDRPAGTRIPYWVVVIDELADLMIAAPFQVETQLVRLAQLARATGIHLVVATQRPSVDVITGLIKANFPTRIAFAVASSVDSRTVLDQGGAEKLLGRGDMLYVPPEEQKPLRVQGVFVSDQEIQRLVSFWTADRFSELRPETFDDLLHEAAREIEDRQEREISGEDDPLLAQAIELARAQETLSTSMLQRKLHIGYPRAARTMDQLEDRGIVAPPDGTNSREVLLARDEEESGETDTSAARSDRPPL